MKIKSKLIILITLIIFVSVLMPPNYSLAEDYLKAIKEPGDFAPSGTIENGTIFLERASIIVSVTSTIGIMVSIISLVTIGIKYLFGSVEGKSEYKKAMIPYVVGLFFLTSVSVVILIIKEIATGS